MTSEVLVLQLAPHGTVAKRTGRDGKQRKPPKQAKERELIEHATVISIRAEARATTTGLCKAAPRQLA
jgi:hypothetical protein